MDMVVAGEAVRTRRTPALVDAARARARVLAGPHPARIAGRKGQARQPDAIAALPISLVRTLADPERFDRVALLAAAAYHANAIALSISSEARAALSEVIDADIRAFAINHRKFAVPAKQIAPDLLVMALKQTQSDARTALSARLDGDENDDSSMSSCLDLALEEASL